MQWDVFYYVGDGKSETLSITVPGTRSMADVRSVYAAACKKWTNKMISRMLALPHYPMTKQVSK